MSADGDEPKEIRLAKKGSTLILKRLSDHFKDVQKAQRSYEIPNDALTSADLGTNANLFFLTRRRIADLSAEIRKLILQLANEYEEEAIRSAEKLVETHLPKRVDRTRANFLLTAQQSLRVSYHSLWLALSVFTQLSRDLKGEIETAKSQTKASLETELLLRNTLIVFEVTAAVVQLMEEFQLQGKTEFEELKKVMKEEVAKNQRADASLKISNKDPLANEDIRRRIEEDLRHREAGRRAVLAKWEQLERDIGRLNDHAGKLRGQLGNLRLIRDNAKNQLSFLQIITVSRMIGENIAAVESMLSIGEMPLAPLRIDDICRLLGVEPPTEPEGQ